MTLFKGHSTNIHKSQTLSNVISPWSADSLVRVFTAFVAIRHSDFYLFVLSVLCVVSVLSFTGKSPHDDTAITRNELDNPPIQP